MESNTLVLLAVGYVKINNMDGITHWQAGTTPFIGTAPHVTLCPQSPWHVAGWRILPVAISLINMDDQIGNSELETVLSVQRDMSSQP